MEATLKIPVIKVIWLIVINPINFANKRRKGTSIYNTQFQGLENTPVVSLLRYLYAQVEVPWEL
jgi:hypothetical protein